MRIPALLLASLLSTSAWAVPATMHHQGRLFDTTGAPLDGSQDVTLAIFDVATGGTALWTETVTTDFDDGYYAQTFGLSTPMDAAVFANDALWAEITVGSGSPLATRIRLDSVAFAMRAGHADRADTATNVSGGTVDATEILINGTTVIDSAGRIDWTAIDSPVAPAHSHAAADVTSGQFDIARFPIGTGVDTIAAGDHSHDIGALTGNLDTSRLTGGIDASTLTGTVPDAAFPTDLTLVGGVRVGDVSATCDSSNVGMIRWTGTDFEGCTDSGWGSFLATTPTGSSPVDAGKSCLTLLQGSSSLPDGVYWIDPDGPSGSNAPFEAYCDMTTGGGGWTLVGLANNAVALSTPDFSADVSDPTTGHYIKPLWGDSGTESRYECGAAGTGVLGHQYNQGSWSWGATPGSFITASFAAPYQENVTWRVMVPGYNPPGNEAADPWGNHVGGVHYPNFGHTGFSAVDNRTFRGGVFTCDPQNTVYGTGDVAWAATTGQRFVRYWLR